jgi:hypothetical protein
MVVILHVVPFKNFNDSDLFVRNIANGAPETFQILTSPPVSHGGPESFASNLARFLKKIGERWSDDKRRVLGGRQLCDRLSFTVNGDLTGMMGKQNLRLIEACAATAVAAIETRDLL